MKKRFLSAALCIAATSTVYAQNTTYLEAGNIRSLIGTGGHLWWDTTSGTARCEFPKNSGKHVGFAAGVWVGGYDGQGQLHVSANTYRSGTKNDFFSGAVSAAGTSTSASQAAWNKVWKITHAQLDSFFATSVHTTANTPQIILRWPARGNTLATGVGGAALPELLNTPFDYAPFIDVNGDGIYNALGGDYPQLRGDEMVWQVYNDVGGPKTSTNTAAMPIQVGMLAWAYKRGTVADNIQFYEYTISNLGGQLDSTVVCVFTDSDLGDPFDDYIGVDSARRLGYTYNADGMDGTTGQVGAYGSQIPIAGTMLLRTEGDVPTSGYRAPAGAFTYFINSSPMPAISDPNTGIHFYRYMTGTNRAGDPFTRDFTGAAGVPTKGYGVGPTTRYIFDGNPSTTGAWSECYSSNVSGDRRFLLSSKAFTLPANEARRVAFALVVSPAAGGCPNTTLTGLQQTADTAIKLYDNPPPFVPTGVAAVEEMRLLRIYPNPASDKLFVEGKNIARIQAYDAAGRKLGLHASRTAEGFVLSTQNLPLGVYAVRAWDAEGRSITHTFAKD